MIEAFHTKKTCPVLTQESSCYLFIYLPFPMRRSSLLKHGEHFCILVCDCALQTWV